MQKKQDNSRRSFLKKSSLAAFSFALGTKIVFAEYFPKGMIPVALLDTQFPQNLPGKHPGLVVLNDKPINAETPPHLLDDKITPRDLFFVRNNGIPPDFSPCCGPFSAWGLLASSRKGYLIPVTNRFPRKLHALRVPWRRCDSLQ